MSTAPEKALAHVRALFPSPGPPGLLDHATITINFHPDRRLADGRTVIQHLTRDGVYRSQFETGISNGGLGGPRLDWEHRMFAGAYQNTTQGRPLYGALNLAGHPDGAAPRFGSCHLVLHPAVTTRATFSHGDSAAQPTILGTATTFGALWRSLLDEVTRTGQALNVTATSPDTWQAALTAPRATCGRSLDGYLEAQIHGGLTIPQDVTAVIADPSFRGTAIEADLRALSAPLRWTPGFVLPAADVPPDLRGPELPPFAQALAAQHGRTTLDAELIGRAPQDQLRKYLWHILVLRGHPHAQATT